MSYFIFNLQSKEAQNAKLQEFYDKSTEITSKIKKDTEACQKAFNDCTEYFGESTSSKTDSSVNTFFGYFSRFVTAWKLAETENEQRQKKLKADADRAASKNKNNQTKPSADKVSCRGTPGELRMLLRGGTNRHFGHTKCLI